MNQYFYLYGKEQVEILERKMIGQKVPTFKVIINGKVTTAHIGYKEKRRDVKDVDQIIKAKEKRLGELQKLGGLNQQERDELDRLNVDIFHLRTERWNSVQMSYLGEGTTVIPDGMKDASEGA